jgi:DNA-binding FadR family transcriptional regulator
MRRIDVSRFERTNFLTTKSGVVGHCQHHSISQRFALADLQNALPLLLAWNPWKLVMALNQASPAYGRAKRVSCADVLFHQEIAEESHDSQVLLQRGI